MYCVCGRGKKERKGEKKQERRYGVRKIRQIGRREGSMYMYLCESGDTVLCLLPLRVPPAYLALVKLAASLIKWHGP